MPLRARLALVADDASLGADLTPVTGGDPLSFVDARPYAARLDEARRQLGETESFVAARATVGGVPAVVGAMEFAFLGGTMSAAVGERVARAFEAAADERRAVVLCTTSGGARMQEGTLALFQMAKTAAAVARFREARRPYVVVWGHPTMGGVAASFGSLADVRLAEPGARIGFAGPRVIEQLLGQPLPEGFQRAEFVLEHGQLDRVVPRERLKAELARLLPLLSGGMVP
jgi:acetyl-CoA carboxylase carboxyl transferase subunit beta